MPSKNNNSLKKIVKNGLASSTIHRTKSPWDAPVLFSGKKDGNLIPSFDYQQLNTIIVENNYTLPREMELVDSLSKETTYTQLDMHTRYENVRVAGGDKDKIAFLCHSGQFPLLKIPSGPTSNSCLDG